jgi:hypothetical protein
MRRLLPGRVQQRLRAADLRREAAAQLPSGLESASREQGDTQTMACRLCSATAVPHRVIGHVTPTQAGAFSSRDQRLVQCSVCEAIYLDPFPTAGDVKLMYEGSVQFSDACYSDAIQAEQILRGYGQRLARLDLFPRDGEKLLEVGAGLAWVARACKLHDPRIITVAQDVSDECASQCPWADDYRVGPVDALPPAEAYQLISLTHVIEHLLEPGEMLKRLSSRLLSGGHIYITAPFRPPLWKTAEGIRPWLSYSYLHVPAHVSYLSETWFQQAGRAAGLRLLRWDPSQDGHQAFEAVLHKPAA